MKTFTKLTLALSAVLTTTLLLANTTTQDSPRCATKIDKIQEQLEIAKKNDNTHRVNGLEISLSKVTKYCTDESLIEDIKEKLSDVKKDLVEHTQDYEEALSENRTNKMQKYQTKIAEDNAEIKRLESELDS